MAHHWRTDIPVVHGAWCGWTRVRVAVEECLQMRRIIEWWLRVRIPISNFLNWFDKYNVPIDIPKRTINDAIKALDAMDYRYKWDKGDRIRTPWASYRRAQNRKYGDDCDGMASLAYALIGDNAELKYKVCLLTVVPTYAFWLGHTVLVVRMVIGGRAMYRKVEPFYNTEWKFTLAEVIKEVNPSDKVVVALNRFENNKWVNVEYAI